MPFRNSSVSYMYHTQLPYPHRSSNAVKFLPMPTIPSSTIQTPPLSGIPQLIQMLDNQHICIKEPLHTILRTSVLRPLQLSRLDRSCYAFLPADICEVVDCLLYSCLRALVNNELLKLKLVLVLDVNGLNSFLNPLLNINKQLRLTTKYF